MQLTSPEKLQALSNVEIANMVQRYFDKERSDSAYLTIFGDIYFQVDGSHIRREDTWVRVPVRPSREPHRLHYMYGLLAD